MRPWMGDLPKKGLGNGPRTCQSVANALGLKSPPGERVSGGVIFFHFMPLQPTSVAIILRATTSQKSGEKRAKLRLPAYEASQVRS